MKKIAGILLLIVLSSNLVSAQFDTSYVQVTKKKFVVTSICEFYKSKYNINNVIYNNGSSYKEIRQSYSSKNNVFLGIGFSFYRIGFSISFLLPYLNIPELKNSKSISFVGGYSLKKFYGELNYRIYRGFQKNVHTFLADTTLVDNTIVSEDVYFQQLGYVLHFFSSKKYNFDANYKNYNIQKKSAITPLLIVGVDYFNTEGNFEITDSIQTMTEFRAVKSFSIKTAAGLAATRGNHKFYATTLAYLGASVNNDRVKDDYEKKVYTKLYPTLEFRTSFGYNSNKFVAAFTFTYDNNLKYLKPIAIRINNYYIGAKVGYKFSYKYLGKASKYL